MDHAPTRTRRWRLRSPRTGVALALITTFALLLSWTSDRSTVGAASTFVETFDGRPAQPTAWDSPRWKVVKHIRENYQDAKLWPALNAHHGHDCSAYPATHHITDRDAGVYQCNDHIMTSLNGGSYGVIYLMPDVAVDARGEVVVKFDVSTLRDTDRDWIDVWFTPLSDFLMLPLGHHLPDLQGPPRRAIHVEQRQNGQGKTNWVTVQYLDHQENWVPNVNFDRGQEDFLTPSASRRDTFEIRIQGNRISTSMPGHGVQWQNSTLTQSIADWGPLVVQFGHHSYTPEKDCTPKQHKACKANTWHWDNVEISPTLTLPMAEGSPDIVASHQDNPNSQTGVEVTLDRPAPQNGQLHFGFIGAGAELSFDNGATWQAAERQPQMYSTLAYSSYRSPIPAGTTRFRVRATGRWWGAAWSFRDLTVLGAPNGVPAPLPTATATRTATPQTQAPTVTPTSTPQTPAPTVSGPTQTPTPVQTATPKPGTPVPGATVTPTPARTPTQPPATSAPVTLTAMLGPANSAQETEYRLRFQNTTSAGQQHLSARVFVDLSEVLAAGLQPKDIAVEERWDQCNAVSAGPLTRWGSSGSVYYVELSSGNHVMSGGLTCEVHLRLRTAGGQRVWNGANDYSQQGLNSATFAGTERIPVYQFGKRLAGMEP